LQFVVLQVFLLLKEIGYYGMDLQGACCFVSQQVVKGFGREPCKYGLSFTGWTRGTLPETMRVALRPGVKVSPHLRKNILATPNYGYEKRQKELAKKRKKEDKLKNKTERKVEGEAGESGSADLLTPAYTPPQADPGPVQS
jgi:hypothetical protein